MPVTVGSLQAPVCGSPVRCCWRRPDPWPPGACLLSPTPVARLPLPPPRSLCRCRLYLFRLRAADMASAGGRPGPIPVVLGRGLRRSFSPARPPPRLGRSASGIPGRCTAVPPIPLLARVLAVFFAFGFPLASPPFPCSRWAFRRPLCRGFPGWWGRPRGGVLGRMWGGPIPAGRAVGYLLYLPRPAQPTAAEPLMHLPHR